MAFKFVDIFSLYGIILPYYNYEVTRMFINESIQTPITKSCDVLVCGGGFGGISAALAAARCGKKVVLLEKLITGIDIPGYATIIVLILLLGGMQLFCIGIIGEYVGRTFVQTKNRPIYIAKEVLDYNK